MTIFEQAQTFSSRVGPRALAVLRRVQAGIEGARRTVPAVLQAVGHGARGSAEAFRDIGMESETAIRLALREGASALHGAGAALGEIPAFPGLLGRGVAALWRLGSARTLRIPRRWRIAAGAAAGLALAFTLEARTGLFEATVLSALASRLGWTVGQGPSPAIVYPQSGPFDIERGYSRIPEFIDRLSRRGYRIREQARFSKPLVMLARAGLTPPWREPPSEGLVIRDADGDTLFRGSSDRDMFASYDEIPPLVTQSLLYIENRGLISEPRSTTNPAVDWARFAKATGLWAGRHIGLPLPVEGGSTLAVQLEKLRHFSGGRTHSPADKLRQIAAASLRAYREGPDTRDARREIVLGYLNSVPLAAVPGHGEIRGLGEGLRRWFARDPHRTMRAIAEPASLRQQARAYRSVLALICSLRAPTHYLVDDRAALETRMAFYTDRLEQVGVLPHDLAAAVRATPLAIEPAQPTGRYRWLAGDKSADAIRGEVAQLLGVQDRYALDHLDLDVESTVDAALERHIHDTFRALADRDSVAAYGLTGEHLLPTGDPAGVTYSLLLLESTPAGYKVCAHVDNLNQPFDPLLQMKMDLGSTAKLRTLAHYLEIMEGLHGQLAGRDPDSLALLARSAPDPLTRWAAATLDSVPGVPLEAFLRLSMERVYSASPYESFFTGGGLHTFHNFDPDDNGRRLTIHEALVKSTNLVFVRLMRDIERYHQARLPYDANSVLADPSYPERRRLLRRAEEQESREILFRAWSRWRGTPRDSLLAGLLPPGRPNAFRAAVVYGAWSADTAAASCAAWIERRYPGLPAAAALENARKVASRKFTLLDQAYLLHMHPLELWCAGRLVRSPGIGWSQLWAASGPPRALAMSWLLDPRHRRAQELRLRVQIEQEAFARMTPYWKHLGFPFRTLVPSYATAIGASGDRPIALARLMGIIVDQGQVRPSTNIRTLCLAAGTPYQTDFEPGVAPATRVMSATEARVLRAVLSEIPQRGTARRLAGGYVAPDGTELPIAGKTGSGDNRYDTFARGGRLISSRPVSRTAVFAFALGERHFGVITAIVDGPAAGAYSFTSALPVAVLRMLAPAITEHLAASRDSSLIGAHAIARAKPMRVPGPPAPPRRATPRPEAQGVMAALPPR